MFKVNKFYLLFFISLLTLNVGEAKASAAYEEDGVSSGPAAAPPSMARTVFLPQKISSFVTKIFDQGMVEFGAIGENIKIFETIHHKQTDHSCTQLAEVMPLEHLRRIIGEYESKSYLYCLVDKRNNCVAINLDTGEIDSIQVGSRPIFSKLVGRELYVFGDLNIFVSVIDTVTKKKIDEDIQVGLFPISSKLVGRELYVVNSAGGSVSVIDTVTKKKTGEDIQVGVNPASCTLVDCELYVVNSLSSSVSVIDTVTKKKTGEDIRVGFHPISCTLVGRELYVVNSSGCSVSVIDTVTKKKTGEDIQVGFYPISCTLVGRELYVVNSAGGSVSVIDTVTKKKTREDIRVGTYPVSCTLVGRELYIVNYSGHSVSVIDTVTKEKIGEDIKIGAFPRLAASISSGLALNCKDGVYVIDYKAYLNHVTARSQLVAAASSFSSSRISSFSTSLSRSSVSLGSFPLLQVVRQLLQKVHPSSSSSSSSSGF